MSTLRLLSVDPGLSTGWVFITLDQRLRGELVGGTVDVDDLDIAIRDWQTWRPTDVVIEFILTLTNSKLNQELSTVASKLTQAFPDATYIRPGQWKPVTGNATLPYLDTRHSKDAARLGLYWLRTHVSPHVRFTLEE